MIRLALILALFSAPAFADAPVVEAVKATPQGGAWRFDVTISHGDTGWDDYADGWRVEDVDGVILGERPLAHPHVDEQPFTRSQSGIVVPDGMTEVFIRVRDNVHGWYDGTTPFTMPQ